MNRRRACLLGLLAGGLVLLAWTLFLAGPTPADALTDCPPIDRVEPPPASLKEMLAQRDIIPTHDHPLVGRPAPDFELADCEGKIWPLKELRDGRPTVLIFYYGFHCIHCVRHLAEVKRDLPLFDELGARVIAISADPQELTRRQFEQHGPFGFPILADPGKAAQAFGVFKPARNAEEPGVRRHGTFVIDGAGTVRWANVGDAPFRRNAALLYQLAIAKGCESP